MSNQLNCLVRGDENNKNSLSGVLNQKNVLIFNGIKPAK